jgi:hypothetical protein
MKKRGRPPKENKQTPEERAAYLREYKKRDYVKAKRRAYEKAKRANETAEEKEERRAYIRFYKANKKL